LLIRAALLQSGFLLEDPHMLANPLEKLVNIALGFSADEEINKLEFSMSEDEDEADSDDEEEKKEETPEADVEEE